MIKAVISDLDGVLCNFEHRRPLFNQHKMKEFYSKLEDDTTYKWCCEILHGMKRLNYEIIYITARPETYKIKTLLWMIKQNIPDGLLFTSPYGINTSKTDSEIKKEIYDKEIKHRYEILFVLEDRKHVVDMWREQELVCLQNCEGKY